MPGPTQNVTVEGFVTDLAFVDQTKSINGLFVDDGANVAALTTKALSYFSAPSAFVDSRPPANRTVNWTATTNPRLVVDNTTFAAFVTSINTLGTSVATGFFKIIDKLLFDYKASDTHTAVETFLNADSDIASIYVPGSFQASTTIVNGTVHLQGGTTQTTLVPSYINFSITLPTGSTTTTYILQLYASVTAWLADYNVSTIVSVIPPLSYNEIFTASLVTTVDNVFSTSSTTAQLSYNTTQSLLGAVSISGISEYKAVVTDGVNVVSAPFNILYKGRPPTLYEIRNAIKAALLSSGVGDTSSWTARIPGVFVSGRFYIVPLWDQTVTKPDQVIFPNITNYALYQTLTRQVLASLGYGDLTEYMDVLSIYYNKMQATVIPDLSGVVDAAHLATIIPDYQNYSASDAQFVYMSQLSQTFSRILNTILTIDSGAQTSTVYTPITEGPLSFYSFTVGSYEMCVISKSCYTTNIGSTQ